MRDQEAGSASLTFLFASAGTLRKDGCCGNSPTSPRPTTAKVRALLLLSFYHFASSIFQASLNKEKFDNKRFGEGHCARSHLDIYVTDSLFCVYHKQPSDSYIFYFIAFSPCSHPYIVSYKCRNE